MEIVPPEGNPSIEKYEVNAKSSSQACVAVVGVLPLGCTLDSLNAATEYTVQVKSCLPSSAGCSVFREETFWTRPKGDTSCYSTSPKAIKAENVFLL